MRIILITLTLLISACSNNGSISEKGASAFPYRYNNEIVKAKPIKKVIVANTSFGRPVMSHLRKADSRVKRYVKEYLKDNGYQVLPEYHFENAWKQAVRSYGQPYDPSTGRIDSVTWQRVMYTAGQTLKKQTDADAIVFADVIEHNAQHNNGLQHLARFNGVNRKPMLRGADKSIPLGFDWNQEIKAASLLVNIYNIDLQRVLMNYGGISTTQELDTKKADPVWVRRRKLLSSEDDIEEAMAIAFHPFIKMSDYPGKEQPYETLLNNQDTDQNSDQSTDKSTDQNADSSAAEQAEPAQ
ncbi:hypothetical protein [Dasania marina]|uniref:hypothetical protein n=1 Tax=Dasania marina TaxID=471499 RepID=UPI0030DC98A5